MRIGRKYVPTTVRFDVVVSVLLLSAFFARLLALTSAPLALSWKNRNYYNFCHHRKSFATFCPGNVICSGIVEIKIIARATSPSHNLNSIKSSRKSSLVRKAMKQTFFEERWNMTWFNITDRIWQGWLGLCKGIGGASSDKKLLNNSINAGRLWGTDLNKLSSTRLVYTMPPYHVAARAKEGKKRHFNVAPGNSDIPANIQMWGNSHLSPNPSPSIVSSA